MVEVYIKRIAQREGETRREAELRTVRECLDEAGIFNPISHTHTGAPYIEDRPDMHISVSHSQAFAAVAIAPKSRTPLGIDIENRNRGQLRKVCPRILNDKELEAAQTMSEGYAKAWTAKEAVYKALGLTGVDFGKDILLEGAHFEEAFCPINSQRLRLNYRDITENELLCIASIDNIFDIKTL